MAGLVIVGVGPGIGTSVAKRFAREGFTVGLIARREETVAAAAEATGGTTWTRTADATDEKALRAALRAFVDAHGTPDVVVYNAAIIRTDEPGELDQATMLDTYAVNVVGAITTAGELLPEMAASEAPGSAARRGGPTYVITSGMVRPDPALTSLSLGKVGVRGLVELLNAWRPEVHTASVTVGGPVEPGGRWDPDEIAEHYWELHTRAVTDQEVRHGC
ncbi:SDR family NAD(P)-dependent oxidoreductase [Actinomycetospora chiangmaiensis]|uniref:SDR family NAD(P)-dependent oxidoreductase n=1 Tax=Actinomycetospora chiangmaiensis TaxID=402650 RepID=UPI00035CD304|nr:SDR family NAD(P)-dependent oxidoreductase [Actinomycetospora chiangmaiensis]